MAAVVVGVDGTEASQEALRLGVREARLRGVDVRAVHVWHVPEGVFLAGYAPSADERAAFEAEAHAVVDGAVAALGAEAAGIVVTPVLLESSSAADELVREAETAALLVLGARGIGAVRELLGTSVSHACMRRAACPVVVVSPHAAATTVE